MGFYLHEARCYKGVANSGMHADFKEIRKFLKLVRAGKEWNCVLCENPILKGHYYLGYWSIKICYKCWYRYLDSSMKNMQKLIALLGKYKKYLKRNEEDLKDKMLLRSI